MFQRAIAADAGRVSPVGVHGAYAKFLWSTGGDRATIVDLFEKACASASAVDASCAADVVAAAADVLASYASFLLTGGGAMTARGEQLLRASLTLQVIVRRMWRRAGKRSAMFICFGSRATRPRSRGTRIS